MTKEEAKAYIREWCPYDKQEEIIKALEQEPCEDATLQEIFCTGCEHKEQQSCPYWDYELKTCRHANIGALATKPCEDAISSEPIKIDEWDIKGKPAELWIVNGKLQIRYQGTIHNTDLPSVTPIRPKGKWETGYTYPDGEYWKCSECGELIKVKFPMNFCNSCGADMRGNKDAT